jgi:hypothetical protein
MFEEFVPDVKIGALKPLSVIDLSAYEFYRLAPPGVMLVMIGVGLGKFSKEDVERVFAPIDGYVPISSCSRVFRCRCCSASRAMTG